MDSYDKLLNDFGNYNHTYRDVKPEDQKGVNDYINLNLIFEEYVNSVMVYTDMWLTPVMGCPHSPVTGYDSCVVNGNKYYIAIGVGD